MPTYPTKLNAFRESLAFPYDHPHNQSQLNQLQPTTETHSHSVNKLKAPPSSSSSFSSEYKHELNKRIRTYILDVPQLLNRYVNYDDKPSQIKTKDDPKKPTTSKSTPTPTPTPTPAATSYSSRTTLKTLLNLLPFQSSTLLQILTSSSFESDSRLNDLTLLCLTLLKDTESDIDAGCEGFKMLGFIMRVMKSKPSKRSRRNRTNSSDVVRIELTLKDVVERIDEIREKTLSLTLKGMCLDLTFGVTSIDRSRSVMKMEEEVEGNAKEKMKVKMKTKTKKNDDKKEKEAKTKIKKPTRFEFKKSSDLERYMGDD